MARRWFFISLGTLLFLLNRDNIDMGIFYHTPQIPSNIIITVIVPGIVMSSTKSVINLTIVMSKKIGYNCDS